MGLWVLATQLEAGPWWGSAVIGFIGGVVGAGATLLGGLLNEGRKARHADALQWDKEIVKLAERLLTSIDKVLHNRPNPIREVAAEEKAAYDRLCDMEQLEQTAILGQLELIAPPGVRVAGLQLQNACLQLVRERYAVTLEGPVRLESTYEEVRELRRQFVTTVREAIRR